MKEVPQIKAKTILLNISKFSAVSIFSAALSIIAIPIITRIFSPEEYGRINMFFSVGNMMMIIVLFGMDSAFIRFFYEPPKNMNKKQIFIFSLLVGCLMNIVFTVLIFLVNPEYIANLVFGENNKGALIALSLYVISLIIFRLLNITYRMNQDAKQYNIQNILQIVINRILFISVAIVSPTYYNAILVITGGMMVLSVVYIWKQREWFSGVNLRMKKSDMSEIFSFSLPLMPTTLILWLNDSIAKMILSGLGKFDDVGILAMATSLSSIVAIIPQGFSIYWSSFMYANYKSQKKIIIKIHNAIILLCIVLVVLIISLQDIFFLLLGSSYRSSQAFFAMIMLNPIQALIAETTSYGINISKKTKYHVTITLFAFSVNLGISYFIIPIIGIIGASIAIAASSIILLVLKTLIGQYFYKSIESLYKTGIGILIIICLCVGNVFYYNELVLREGVCLAILIISSFVYRTEVQYMAKLLLIIIDKLKLIVKY